MLHSPSDNTMAWVRFFSISGPGVMLSDLLPQRSRWNAEDMGAEMGASRTTARRYLEYLVGTGELSAEVAYGSVGRPERQYLPKS